ncbi:MAG: hypothetical protein ACQERZ_08080 [Fusobacteriota bacterium]
MGKDILTKKKIKYIWHYYKFHILLVVFLIYSVFSIINYWIINTPKEVLARVVLYEEGIDVKKAKDLENYLNQNLNEDMNKKEIRVENWDLDAPRGLEQKMQLMVSAQEIDLIVSGGEIMNKLEKYEMFDTFKKGLEISDKKEFNRRIFYYKKPYVSMLKNSKRKAITGEIINLLQE